MIPYIDWEALQEACADVDEIAYLEAQLIRLQAAVDNANKWFDFTRTLGWVALGLSLALLAYMIIQDVRRKRGTE